LWEEISKDKAHCGSLPPRSACIRISDLQYPHREVKIYVGRIIGADLFPSMNTSEHE